MATMGKLDDKIPIKILKCFCVITVLNVGTVMLMFEGSDLKGIL